MIWHHILKTRYFYNWFFGVNLISSESTASEHQLYSFAWLFCPQLWNFWAIPLVPVVKKHHKAIMIQKHQFAIGFPDASWISLLWLAKYQFIAGHNFEFPNIYIFKATGLVIWPIFDQSLSWEVRLMIPVALLLTSTIWWENFVSRTQRSSSGLVSWLAKLKEQVRTFLKIWKSFLWIFSIF